MTTAAAAPPCCPSYPAWASRDGWRTGMVAGQLASWYGGWRIGSEGSAARRYATRSLLSALASMVQVS
eukprot:6176280-Pleurochrysis_carterae.AAC.3